MGQTLSDLDRPLLQGDLASPVTSIFVYMGLLDADGCQSVLQVVSPGRHQAGIDGESLFIADQIVDGLGLARAGGALDQAIRFRRVAAIGFQRPS